MRKVGQAGEFTGKEGESGCLFRGAGGRGSFVRASARGSEEGSAQPQLLLLQAKMVC